MNSFSDASFLNRNYIHYNIRTKVAVHAVILYDREVLLPCADFIGINKGSSSRIVDQVSHEIARLGKHYICFQESQVERRIIM